MKHPKCSWAKFIIPLLNILLLNKGQIVAKWREKVGDREKWKGITEEDNKWRENAADREKWLGITEEDDKLREKLLIGRSS